MEQNIYNGTIGGPVLNEEGAVHTGRGKYRIQFLGSDNPKEVTKRVAITAVGVVAAILLIATILVGKQPKEFPKFSQLHSSIGLTLEEAAQKVGVKLADMTKTEEGVYKANKTIKLDGVSFDLYFYEERGKCSGFAYIADYTADAKKASKDIYNTLVNMRIKTFDKYPYYMYREDNETYAVSRKNLLNHLENREILLVKETFQLYASDCLEPTKSFMEDLEIKEGGNVLRNVLLYRDKGVTYDPESQRVQLVLSYKVEYEREPLYQ